MSSSSPSIHQPSFPDLLCALFVFRNILNQELIRSVHGYQATEKNEEEEEEEEEERWVEREFIFSPSSCIEVRVPVPHQLLLLEPKARLRFREGRVIGLWHCILAFDYSAGLSASAVPPILSFSRNPRLKSIPTLASDLEKVFQLQSRPKTLQSPSEITCVEKEGEPCCSGGLVPFFYQDQLAHSSASIQQELLEDQQYNHKISDVGASVGKKRDTTEKKRATTEHVASIALADLAKYFNLPIAEASRNLKVGLTVLKRKCREFGIPRWPHRKIKSLDTLIHNLQEEVTRQERENKVAAVKAAIRRQQMLESEKKGIERRPFTELQGETRRFRQDVFKRRHRAKALHKKCLCPSLENDNHHLSY